MEPRDPQDRDRQYKQQIATVLTEAQGWKEVVLAHILHRTGVLDATAARTDLTPEQRLDAIGRRQELLDFVKMVYRTAELPNPYEEARLGLYTMTLPPQQPKAPAEVQAETAMQDLLRRRPRRSGSVA